MSRKPIISCTALLVFVVLAAAPGFGAAPPTALWARTTVGGSGMTDFTDVAVDATGNAYTVGVIQEGGTIAFGNGVTATNPGDRPVQSPAA